MTTAVTAPDRASLSSMDERLSAMMVRTKAILADAPLTEDTLVEITSIYNNVAYVFLYLEANERYVNFDRLLPWRAAFHQDPELDRALLARLVALRCTDPEAERSRLDWVNQLRAKEHEPDTESADRMAGLVGAAKDTLAALADDQAALLAKLGVEVGAVNPPAVFYKMSARIANPVSRTKLARAWRALRDRKEDELVDLVDHMVGELHRQSTARGHHTVLDETLTKCRVTEAQVDAFLQRYLDHALSSYRDLEDEVRTTTGAVDNPMDHFGRHLETLVGAVEVPKLPLRGCLDFVYAVAAGAFGLTVEMVSRTEDVVMTVRVRAGDQEVGQIDFDLWNDEGKALKANHTKGIRNRTDWAGLVQLPVAYVSCRFSRTEGEERITFQNAHSLFHEFGHAINHLLIRKRISNQSGLEYLPLERLEYLSMWFEKWVFHPAFADHLGMSESDHAGLRWCQRIKMIEYRRTYVDRAVTAALDFDVYRHTDGGVRESFQRLDQRFGISAHCTLDDFLPYFTWPMLQANPGAYFAYLWGAADSGEQFRPFQDATLAAVAAMGDQRARFASCLDFDLPSNEPDVRAVFEFYDRAR
jgi:oligopeptidase A